MNGNFSYYNPTKLYFGKNSIECLEAELLQQGKNILLVYGGGSIKKNGIYKQVLHTLETLDKNVFEISGVMPNPTYQKLLEGCKVAKENNIDFILAIGGGSVIDYAKGIANCTYCTEDAWTKYYENWEEVTNEVLPIGCILTMVGTGSEMNNCSVITNTEKTSKLGRIFDDRSYPKFTILDPTYTYTLPKYQMVAGIYDIMSHILEQYLSGDDDSTNDYLAEGLMQSLIHSSKIAIDNPLDYEARSNIMWTATWALNSLIGSGKPQDWQAHGIGETIGAYTDATHGMTLSATAIAYYEYLLPNALDKFVRFAKNVWHVQDLETKQQTALAGLETMKHWMQELGLVLSIQELGVTEEMLEKIASDVNGNENAYRALTKEAVLDILKKSW